ncbi:MAG: MFS transporter, partial [SAR202 cluster bacterium]|nr:MFS transporter [SAR202 cluster bacterium]
MANTDHRNEDSTSSSPSIAESKARSGWLEKLLIPFASLENRNFRLLWLGMLGQASAMWADQVARSWLAWQLTGSATAIGLVNVFRALPLITVGLVGGVIADRFDKRTILIVIQTWSLCIYIVMVVLLVGGWIVMWHVYVTALLLGVGMSMNQPVRTSLIPQLLGGRLLVNAISLNSIAINVSKLTGPAAVGVLIAMAGGNVAPAYIIAVAVYVLIIVATIMIDHRSVGAGNKQLSFRADFVEGFRYLLVENRTALTLVVLATGPLAFAFSYITLLPVLVTEELNASSSSYGAIQSVGAIGALVGGFWLASARNVRNKGWLMLVTGSIYGGAVVLLGYANWLIVAFALSIVIGASQTIFRTANNSTILEITPQRLQGRIVSVTFLDMGIQSVAAIVAGMITDAYGVSAG